MKPPRALWVPFELGRPLGVPDAPAFQRRVLLAALKLLEAPAGPLLEDFPEDAPASAGKVTTLACPVNFAQEGGDLTEPEQLHTSFKKEMVSMRPWYDMAVEKHGRTTVGVSKMNLEDIVDFIYSFLKGVVPENPRDDIPLAYVLKLAVDDLKAYYLEGITAQPGQEAAPSKILSDWFWRDTVAGKVLLAVKEACMKSEDEMIRYVGGKLVVPFKVAGNRAK